MFAISQTLKAAERKNKQPSQLLWSEKDVTKNKMKLFFDLLSPRQNSDKLKRRLLWFNRNFERTRCIMYLTTFKNMFFKHFIYSLGVCLDLDNNATDTKGNACSPYYNENPEMCGAYDDYYFHAGTMCCACKGIYLMFLLWRWSIALNTKVLHRTLSGI